MKQSPIYDQFQQAFHRYYDPLCQYAYSIVKEPHACEDIVQETFLRIWEKKQELIGTEQLRFYIYTAVRNNCLTYLEKNNKRAFVELSNQEEPAAPAEPENHRNNSATDYNSLLKDALDRLPGRCREIFVLSRISKLTYQQIADTLNISIKTVENQMGKALRILRGFMKEKQFHTIALILLLYIIIHLVA